MSDTFLEVVVLVSENLFDLIDKISLMMTCKKVYELCSQFDTTLVQFREIVRICQQDSTKRKVSLNYAYEQLLPQYRDEPWVDVDIDEEGVIDNHAVDSFSLLIYLYEQDLTLMKIDVRGFESKAKETLCEDGNKLFQFFTFIGYTKSNFIDLFKELNYEEYLPKNGFVKIFAFIMYNRAKFPKIKYDPDSPVTEMMKLMFPVSSKQRRDGDEESMIVWG